MAAYLNRTFWLALISFSFASMVRGAVTIGNESAVAFPLDASYAGAIATRPFNGTTQHLNPPIFSWSAKGANFLGAESADAQWYSYVFQLSTNGFTSLLVDMPTISNMENRFDAITNAAGGAFSNAIISWRVFYVGTNGLTNFGITNGFYLSVNATNWSRGSAATDSYLTNRVHPFILITDANQSATHTFLKTNDTAAWLIHSNVVHSYTNVAGGATRWWTNELSWHRNHASWPTNQAYPTSTNLAGLSESVPLAAMGSILLHYAVTRDASLTNHLVRHYNEFVQWYLDANYAFLDAGSGDTPVHQILLALGSDWLWPLLSSGAKANAILAGDRTASYFLWNASTWSEGPFGSGYDYTFALRQKSLVWFSLAEQGTSHNQYNNAGAAIVALVFSAESTNALELLKQDINYFLSRGNFTGGFAAINQGRGYATVGAVSGTMLFNYVNFAKTFPAITVERTPFLNAFGQWAADVIPPGWREYHGATGDGGGVGSLYQSWSSPDFAHKLAMLTQNGRLWLTHTNSKVFRNIFGGAQNWYDIAQAYQLWPPPAPITNGTDAVYLEDGWVIAASKPLNAADVFTNGVGFNLVARPRGSEGGHSTHCDGDVELWAYGAKVTDSGSVNLDSWGYGHEAHNNPAIAGYGPKFAPQYGNSPVLPYYSRIVAATNSAVFSYARADMTPGFTNAKTVVWIPTNAYVTKAHRHVLFPQRKYFVIYDDLASSVPNSYQFKWHILQPGIRSLTSTSFVYSATNFAGQHVTNHVFFASSGQTVSNMTGFAVQTNAVTGTFAADAGATWRHTNVLWFGNAVSVTNWHFMVAIVPQGPTNSVPVFMRIDDNTISVAYDGVTETNTFGTNYVGAYTYRVETIGDSSSGEGSEPGGIRRARAGRVQAVKVIN